MIVILFVRIHSGIISSDEISSLKNVLSLCAPFVSLPELDPVSSMFQILCSFNPYSIESAYNFENCNTILWQIAAAYRFLLQYLGILVSENACAIIESSQPLLLLRPKIIFFNYFLSSSFLFFCSLLFFLVLSCSLLFSFLSFLV